MEDKIYFDLLLLSFIWVPGIISLSEKNINEESLDRHIRKKRLIDLTPNGNKPIKKIDQVPYIVSLVKNGEPACGASILSADVVVTASHCLESQAKFMIISGSARILQGIKHNITRKLFFPHRIEQEFTHDVVLLTISPPINFSNSPNKKITLYNGHVRPNTIGTISGWGLVNVKWLRNLLTMYPNELRSITVPIMSLQDCQHAYSHISEHLQITDANICTYDSNRCKYCSDGDSGNPLVVGGELVGLMTWSSRNFKSPDVFINLAHPEYRNWILSNIEPPRNSHTSPQRPERPETSKKPLTLRQRNYNK